jgi:hypothetical protein
VNLEADDAKKMLWETIKKNQKAGASAPVAPAPAPVLTWRDKIAARTSGTNISPARVDVGNTFMFPSLGGADTSVPIIPKSRNTWASLAMESEETTTTTEAPTTVTPSLPISPASDVSAVFHNVKETDLVLGATSKPLCENNTEIEDAVRRILTVCFFTL